MDFGGYPALKAQRSDHSLPFRNDGVDTQGAVERGRPPLPVRGVRENPQMLLKFELENYFCRLFFLKVEILSVIKIFSQKLHILQCFLSCLCLVS